MRIATIVAAEEPEIRSQAEEASAHADLLELRIDWLSPPARDRLSRFLADLPRPVIATCRRHRDGGRFEGSEEERVALLRRAAAAGASYLDVELGSAAESLIDAVDCRFIASHHDLHGVPPDLKALAEAVRGRPGVALGKLVVQARALDDNLRIRALLTPRGAPLVAFCMGEAGRPSRLLARAWGSAATYGSASARPAAAGQMSVREMDRIYGEGRATGRTQLAGILGSPLAHSLPPGAHNAAYRHLHMDWLYVPLESETVEPAMRLARALGLRGLSVTAPHKLAIREHLSTIDPLGSKVGAVNTVVMEGDRARGFNTDVEGAVSPLRRRVELRGAEVAVVGAGGAARALVHGLLAAGAKVTIFNRTRARARALAEEVGVAHAGMEALRDHRHEILVNATSVGMAPRAGETPVPGDWLRAGLVYDLVYNPPRTRLLHDAATAGLGTLGGLEMFVAQAVEQFRMFTGRAAPVGVMREVAERALAEATWK